MKEKQKTTQVVAVLGAFILVVGSLFATSALQNFRDAALLAGPHSYPVAANQPAPTGLKNPMIQAIWDEKNYYQNSAFVSAAYDQLEPIKNFNYAPYDTVMQEAGVLPTEKKADNRITEGYLVDTGLGITRCNEITFFEDKIINYGIALEKNTKFDFDLEKGVKNYIAYLELEELGDWVKIQPKEDSRSQSAIQYSPSAQIIVQITYLTNAIDADYYQAQLVAVDENELRAMGSIV